MNSRELESLTVLVVGATGSVGREAVETAVAAGDLRRFDGRNGRTDD